MQSEKCGKQSAGGWILDLRFMDQSAAFYRLLCSKEL
jgi:hypothetical protein